MHDSTQIVLIGGYNDGKRVMLPEWFPAIPSEIPRSIPQSLPKSSATPTSWKQDVEIHTLRKWTADGRDANLYVLEGMSEAEAMDRLLANYHPPGLDPEAAPSTADQVNG